MRPLAHSRLAWWHSLVSALVVLGAVAAIGAVWLLAEWGGRRAVLPLLGFGALFVAVTAQSTRARVGFAFIGGVLVRG